ncbi:MAG TPA: peroxiredoxin [Beijerinckiaceae bacterium]|jgi:peroxiredoxin Q/BCP|nr:peroxiredoxin [Beijerinckiaceae bacterium]
MLHPGDAAPPFSLPATGGRAVSLAGLKGRTVALYFYPKDDTSGCTREAQDFNALRDAFAACNAEVIGVSADSLASHDKFRTKYGLDLTLASDKEKRALEAYGVWVEKSMFGVRYMGVERSTFLIDRDGRIARVWRKARVRGHAQEVLAAAQAL